MSVGEYTVSNIHMDHDQKEEEKKKSTIDIAKLQQDIATQVQLASQGKLHEAIEGLLNLEKMSRLAEDITATKASCTAVLDVCYQAKQWKLLEEQVVLLAKRRSQLKQAIQAFVRQAMTYINSTPDQDTKVSLIKTLLAVTEGKIFVEIERARLTRRLAQMKEVEGKTTEAAEILQEVPVETFGAMAKTEKIAFILEQVRLCLDKQDFIRAQILSRKISSRAFVERKGESKGEIGIEGTAIEAPEEGVPTLPELKLSYYNLMIRYYAHYNNYLEMTRCYKAIYEADTIQADTAQWSAVLKKICWFIALSPAYSTEHGSSSDHTTLMQSTLQDKKLKDLPQYHTLLTQFNTSEIISWPVFHATYQAEIAAQPDIFTDAKRIEDLKLRVNEHNVMVITKYYSRISTARLAQLLDLTPLDAEKLLSDMVVGKAVSARIDRPAGVVTIGSGKEPEELLNSWAANITKLLGLVEKSCQQISKECMVHKVVLDTGSTSA